MDSLHPRRAWRDPLIKADSFAPTLHHIVGSHGSSLDRIAGFASLDYTLSGGGGGGPDSDSDPNSDRSRSGRHPDHVVDVLRGIVFLQEITGFAEDYILLGHSCGATLSFQVLMDGARWVVPPRLSGGSERADSTPSVPPPPPKVTKPIAVIGLDGIYDLPGLIRDPGEARALDPRVRGLYARGLWRRREGVVRGQSRVCQGLGRRMGPERRESGARPES